MVSERVACTGHDRGLRRRAPALLDRPLHPCNSIEATLSLLAINQSTNRWASDNARKEELAILCHVSTRSLSALWRQTASSSRDSSRLNRQSLQPRAPAMDCIAKPSRPMDPVATPPHSPLNSQSIDALESIQFGPGRSKIGARRFRQGVTPSSLQAAVSPLCLGPGHGHNNTKPPFRCRVQGPDARLPSLSRQPCGQRGFLEAASILDRSNDGRGLSVGRSIDRSIPKRPFVRTSSIARRSCTRTMAPPRPGWVAGGITLWVPVFRLTHKPCTPTHHLFNSRRPSCPRLLPRRRSGPPGSQHSSTPRHTRRLPPSSSSSSSPSSAALVSCAPWPSSTPPPPSPG